jgi:hypothetical protein
MVSLTRVRAGVLAVLALGGAVAVIGVGSGSGAPDRPIVGNAHERASETPLTPPVFAAVSSAEGSESSVELRSVATGRVVSVLGHLGGSWTNNGFAFSPDERFVYFTLIPKSSRWQSLLLEQLSVATHRRRLIADGEQPSVSSNGRFLAHVSGEGRSAAIVVRDVASNRRRALNLARLVGPKNDMLNAAVAWLGDGTQLAVFEACCAIAASTTGAPARSRGSSAASNGLHLIVVSVPRHGSLSARRVVLPGATQMPQSVGTDATRPNSLLVSWLIGGDRAAVERLTISRSRATLGRVLTIAHSLVVSFDASGRQLLYLLGHSPPNLWTATINDHQLDHRHLLVKNPSLDALAW